MADDTTYLLDDSSGTKSFSEGDDITEGTKQTLREYLKNLLDKSSNAYKPSPGFADSSDSVDFDSARHRTPALTTPEFSSFPPFSKNFLPRTPNYEQFSYSDPGEVEDSDPFNLILDKSIKSHEGFGTIDGGAAHLLSGIKKNKSGKKSGIGDIADDAPVLQQRISAVLKNNRFHPETSDGSPYINDGQYSEGMTTVQKELGEFNTDAEPVNVDQLRRIGALLMLQGAGKTSTEDEEMSQLFTQPQIQLQLGRKEFQNLTAESVLERLGLGRPNNVNDTTLYNAAFEQFGAGAGTIGGGRSDKDKYGNRFTTGDSTSYGHLNTFNQPFDTALPIGMAVLCAEALLVLVVAGLILSLVPGGAHGIPDPMSVDDLIYGEWDSTTTRDSDAVWRAFKQILGIPRTRVDFNDCLLEGIKIFYGMKDDEDSLLASVPGVLTGAVNIMTAPGYYVGVMRSVVRDIEQIAAAVEKFLEAMALSLISGSLDALFGIFKSIAESTSWKFLMVMISVGNIGFVAQRTYPYYAVGGIPPNNQRTTGKTRWGQVRGSDGSLVWRQGSTPSSYLLPQALAVAEAAYSPKPGVVQGAQALVEDKGVVIRGTESGGDISRLGLDVVEQIEAQLDTEYVPFYFHDLRTNEIISFHAFLESLNESIDASYNSSDHLGRVEPVRIYAGARRSLTLSFWVASSRRENQAHMWYDLNRLVSMLYPQFSAGTLLMNGIGQQFRMPFSQVQTASPLIRLRIGDLIRSNGSKFAIARLFGAGEPVFMDSMKKGLENQAKEQNRRGKYAVELEKLISKARARFGYRQTQLAANMKKQVLTQKARKRGNKVIKEYFAEAYSQEGGVMLDPWPLNKGDVVKATDTARYGHVSAEDGKHPTSFKFTDGPYDLRGQGHGQSMKGSRFLIVDAFGKGGAKTTVKLGGSRDVARTDVEFVGGGVFGDPLEGKPWKTGTGELKEKRKPTAAERARFGKERNYGDAKDTTLGGGIYLMAFDYTEKEFYDTRHSKSYSVYVVKMVRMIDGAPEYSQDERLLMVYSSGRRAGKGGVNNFDLDIDFMTTYDRPEGQKSFSSLAQEAAPIDEAKIAADQESVTFKFFDAATNPIIRSFAAAGGKGLAGFITAMSMDYGQSTWDVENTYPTQKAPTFVRVDLQFDVVHDIAPGLDSDGYMRAPLWPVGLPSAINQVNDDIRDGVAEPAVTKG